MTHAEAELVERCHLYSAPDPTGCTFLDRPSAWCFMVGFRALMTLEKEPLGHNIQWPMVRLSSFYRFLKKDFVGPVMLD